MKRDISIILSLIALVGVIILAMLWCCRSMSLSAVSLDTFIGVMAATIGLLVTFAIGWQVINALRPYAADGHPCLPAAEHPRLRPLRQDRPAHRPQGEEVPGAVRAGCPYYL